MQNYIIVGAGGTGSHLLPTLARYLSTHQNPWQAFVIDGDTVEVKNLERQMFDPTDVLENKAVAAVRALNDWHFTSVSDYLGEDNIDRLIQDGDIVLICVDNFTVRKRIEERVLALDNAVVINGGNEKDTGSVQLWVRKGGENITPRIGYLHPEIKVAETDDRAVMTCQQAAALPGGEQTIIANMMSATMMLTALWRYDNDLYSLAECSDPSPETWTEFQFDLAGGVAEHIDQRITKHWRS